MHITKNIGDVMTDGRDFWEIIWSAINIGGDRVVLLMSCPPSIMIRGL